MKEFFLDNIIFIFLILILIFGFLRGRELGLVKKVMSLGMLIATIIITKFLTPKAVLIIKDVTNIESTITDIIYQAFEKTNVFDSKLNIDAIKNIIGTSELFDNMKNQIATGIANVIINVGCSIAVFILIFIILKIIFKLLDVVDYIPVIGSINKFLGGVLGVFEAMLFIWVVFAVIRALDDNIPAVHDVVMKINNNPYVKYIYDHNSVYNFFLSFKS